MGLVDRDQLGAGVGADSVDGLDDVGQVRPADDGQAEEAGELDGDHLGGRGGRDGDVDDRDVVSGVGVALAVDDLEGLAELGDRGGLAGAGRAGQDQAAPAGVGVAVEVGQPASLGDDLADDRGRDDQQPGVVVEPRLVIRQSPGAVESAPLRVGQQFRRGRLLIDEAPPAGQDGELPVPGLIVCVVGGDGGGGGCTHQCFCASSWALKIPSGITLATGSPLSCRGVSGASASSAAGGTWPAGVLLPAAVALAGKTEAVHLSSASPHRSRRRRHRPDVLCPALGHSMHADVVCLLAGKGAGSGTRHRSPAVRREPCIARSVQDQPAGGRSFLGALPRHRRTPPAAARQRPAPAARASGPRQRPPEPGPVHRCGHQPDPPPDIRPEKCTQ